MLAQQVHGQHDSADISGALAIAKQTALDPVITRHNPELCGRNCRAAVAVRVVDALGGSVEEEGEALRVRLPLAPVVG
ncbi:MAG: hypothetical protein WD249_08160 [Gaiellaceae bacterium]